MNFSTYGAVSLGGVTVDLSLLGWEITRWWPRAKQAAKPKNLLKLLPFAVVWLYGMLLILAAGGLLGAGAGADWSLWGSSAIGNAALAYGVGGGTPDVTRSSNLILTDGGHAVVIIATVVLIVMWTKRRGFNWMVVRALLSGFSLGLASVLPGSPATSSRWSSRPPVTPWSVYCEGPRRLSRAAARPRHRAAAGIPGPLVRRMYRGGPGGPSGRPRDRVGVLRGGPRPGPAVHLRGAGRLAVGCMGRVRFVRHSPTASRNPFRRRLRRSRPAR